MAGMNSLALSFVAELMETQPPKWACYIALDVPTGCRVSEMIELRRADLIDDDGQLRRPIGFFKLKARGDDPNRKLFIPRRYQPYVMRFLHLEAERGYTRPDDWVFRGHDGKHISRFAVYRHFRALLGPGYGTHWPRKTFAQEMYKYYLAKNPGDPLYAVEMVRRALGHKRIETTIRYLGIVESNLEIVQNEVFN